MASESELEKGHDGTCETVTIESPNGPVVINKSDFDEKKHKLAKNEADPKKTGQGQGSGANK